MQFFGLNCPLPYTLILSQLTMHEKISIPLSHVNPNITQVHIFQPTHFQYIGGALKPQLVS
jgi:hypothetical protein